MLSVCSYVCVCYYVCKCASYDVHHTIICWLKDYLTYRSQTVTVGGKTSDPLPALPGLPQGLVLGPLLFISMIFQVLYAAIRLA